MSAAMRYLTLADVAMTTADLERALTLKADAKRPLSLLVISAGRPANDSTSVCDANHRYNYTVATPPAKPSPQHQGRRAVHDSAGRLTGYVQAAGSKNDANKGQPAQLTQAKITEIKSALSHIPADAPYDVWVTAVGFALAHYGDVGFQLWRDWSLSSLDEGHAHRRNSEQLVRKWAGFPTQSLVHLGTLFQVAKDYGWTPPQREVWHKPLPTIVDAVREGGQDAMDVERGRARLKAELTAFLDAYEAWIVVGRKGPAPRLVIRGATGVGKSQMVQELMQNARFVALDIGVDFQVLTKDKAKIYQKGGAWFRHGREDMTEWGGFDVPHHCPKVSGGACPPNTPPSERPVSIVSQLVRREQAVARNLCAARRCEHGERRELKRRMAAANTVLTDTDVHACVWLDHAKEAEDHQFIVVVSAGFCDSDAKYQGKERLHILDESPEWTHTGTISSAEVGEYISRCDAAVRAMEKPGVTHFELGAKTFLVARAHEIVLRMRNKWLRLSASCGLNPLTYGIVAAADEDQQLAESLGDLGDDAFFEKPEWRDGKFATVPLRATREIVRASKAGGVSIKDGSILVQYHHQIFDRLDRNAGVILLDATLPRIMCKTFEALGARVVHIVVKQHVDVIVDGSRYHGKPRPEDAAENARRWAQLRQQYRLDHGEYPVICCGTKDEAMALIALVVAPGVKIPKNRADLWDFTIDLGIGWTGWHDTGHNEWKYKHQIKFGGDRTPRAVLGEKWDGIRSLSARYRPDVDLPRWRDVPQTHQDYDDIWQKEQWVPSAAGTTQRSRCRLHADAPVREFIRDRETAQAVQWVGRGRWVNAQDDSAAPTTRGRSTFVGGGVVDWAAHGITPTYVNVVTSKKTWGEKQDDAAQEMADAAQAMAERGDKITRSALEAEYRQRQKGIGPTSHIDNNASGTNATPTSAPRHAAYSAWLQKFGVRFASYLSSLGCSAVRVQALRNAAERLSQEHQRAYAAVAEAVLESAVEHGIDVRDAAIAWMATCPDLRTIEAGAGLALRCLIDLGAPPITS
jgi:hypothetical protein